jgi:23S rRNA (adenine2030-N6)-methyltransferase
MNYRHAFHAGNFADVIKHATLVRILVHLCSKPTPFRVIDTHAGSGLYDLAGSPASRSGEWHDGIARLFAAPAAPAAQRAKTLLAPYLEAVAALNRADELTAYPGSPMLVRAFLRGRDRPHCVRARAERGGRARTPSQERPALQGDRDRRLDRP